MTTNTKLQFSNYKQIFVVAWEILNMKTSSITANQVKSIKPNLPNHAYQTEQKIQNQTYKSNKSKASKFNS